jgi:hypothetical protein
MGDYFGSNSRGQAPHSKALGWHPKLTTKDMLESVLPEIEAMLKQQQKA